MKHKHFFSVTVAALLLVACRSPGGVTDVLQSGQNHVEASRCEGIDRYAEAIADLEQALEDGPDSAAAHYWLFVAYQESGDPSQAANTLSALETLAEEGDDPATLFWLFNTYLADGDSAGQEQQLGALEDVAAANPEEAEAHFWLGRALFLSQDLQAALEAFQSAVEQDPEHALAHFWLGQIYSEDGNLELAYQEFEAVLQLDPDNAAAYHNRGVVAFQTGTLAQALTDLQDALSRDPDDPQTHYQLGALYLMQAIPTSPMGLPDAESMDSAEQEFDSALELCPGMIEPLIGLGNLYLLQQNPQAALEPLNQALESAPDSAEAWFALSQAQSYLGEIEAACDSLASFLDLSPPAVWIEQAETMRAEFGCPGESE